jgi:hypothetical protein
MEQGAGAPCCFFKTKAITGAGEVMYQQTIKDVHCSVGLNSISKI